MDLLNLLVVRFNNGMLLQKIMHYCLGELLQKVHNCLSYIGGMHYYCLVMSADIQYLNDVPYVSILRFCHLNFFT